MIKVYYPPSHTSTLPPSTDVDVLQVDAASVTSSVEDQKRGAPGAAPPERAGGPGKGGETRNGGNRGGAAGGNPPSSDDLRNYAYEGEGSSPGSLSSCKWRDRREGG